MYGDPLRIKICRTCQFRLPIVEDWSPYSEEAHKTPVSGCQKRNDIDSKGKCDDYICGFDGKPGRYGQPPKGRLPLE